MCRGLEQFRHEGWLEGRQEGLQKGRQEGLQEGQQEGQQQGIRFELLGLGLIGRISARGLSEKQVEPLLGAASCLLAMGFSMAEVLDLINRRPWGK